MKISIDDEARDYIKSKGKDSIYTWNKIIASWRVSYIKPSVKMGKPRDLKLYNKYDADDITVYVRSDVQTKEDSLTIKFSKESWLEKLVVEGMIYKDTP